ncbi:MAG: 16S rRNA (guanine(527)-N(7))-methyltransferase RsmG [Bacteroidales bacterium]|nr:16S rRNA (guanine(527)-N(7))-methyltransferase RsmG [Bacteroidales bacterium]
MNTVERYFPDLTPLQRERFAALAPLYRDWNAKINVISRKDMDSFYEHHVLHSLAVAKAVRFPEGATVLDLGTGGGFPGIPLAILFPETHFTLCDSIGKKIRVAAAVVASLGLENVETVNARVETLPGRYDYVVSRAVAPLTDLYGWVKGRFSRSLICLKGGEVEAEAEACIARHRLSPERFTFCEIAMWYQEPWFEGKKLVILAQ